MLKIDQHRAVPMRLFATWDVDRTSTNCVPRLCNMTLTRLTISKPLETDLNSLAIAVKLQYPHFVKRKSNSLLIMLQRRKKYKARPIPGFKTLAVGSINLTQVLQSMLIRELPLYSDSDKTNPAAKLYLLNLGSTPLEQDDLKLKEQSGEYSDEDDDESTPNEEGGSDSELMVEDGVGGTSGHHHHHHHHAAAHHQQMLPSASSSSARSHSNKGFGGKFVTPASRFASRQKNLKDKFIKILKKFKMSEEEALDADEGEEDGYDQQPTQQEIEALFKELENLSDSGPDQGDTDTLSVKSTPKPSLRPYFNSDDVMADEISPAIENVSEDSKESADSQAGDLDTTDQECSDVPARGASKPSTTSTPRSPGPDKKDLPKVSSLITPSSSAIGSTPPREQTRQSITTADKKNKILSKYPLRQTSEDVVSKSDRHFMDRVSQHGSRFSTSATKIVLPPAVASKEPPLSHRPATEQLTAMLAPDENFVPECVHLVSASDVHCQGFVNALRDKYPKLFVLTSQNDVKTFFTSLVNRLQRFSNINSGHPQIVKISIIGGDRFIGYCLKSFVETFAPKPSEWLHFVRYYLIAPGWSIVGRCLSAIDHNYSTLFGDAGSWWDKCELSNQDVSEVISKIAKYLSNAKTTASLPIAEAMLQLKDKGSLDEMSSQIFVPFIVDVRFGGGESGSSDSPYLESPGAPGQQLSGSPPNSAPPGTTAVSSSVPVSSSSSKTETTGSPPGSPHIQEKEKCSQSSAFLNLNEAQDLQIEYWAPSGSGSTVPTSGTNPVRSDSIVQKSGSISGGQIGGTKFTLKNAFRSLIITRVPSNNSLAFAEASVPGHGCLTVKFIREKKKDKMLQKLGMKNKDKIDSEQKKQFIDNVSRLICSTKQHVTMKLFIDGVEWTNVKFFQITAQWQTHVKFIPVAVFNIDTS